MKQIYLDTETTGLKIGRMFQLAYILRDKGKVEAKNFYFALPEGSMTMEALQVHGVSDGQTVIFSKGKSFADQYPEIKKDFEGTPERKTQLIAHNMKFDSGFIKNEIKLAGFPELQNVSYHCTVQYFTPVLKLPAINYYHKYKYPNMQELVREFKITDRQAREFALKTFNCRKDKIRYHDARYDVTMLYLCCDFYRNFRKKETEEVKYGT